MQYYYTLIDKHYLIKGITLYRSLCLNVGDFTLFVLCLDGITYDLLCSLSMPNVQAVKLETLEKFDLDFLAIKQTRSALEYCFTSKPCFALYLFKEIPEGCILTYLDSDLFFYSNPAPIFQEIEDGSSVLLTEQRHPPHWPTASEHYGNYNAGFISFRKDENGQRCVAWWRDCCLEWCFDRVEPGRFGDQKYLDEWPNRFDGVRVCSHKGANLAFWNWTNYKVSKLHDCVYVDDQSLIFCHVSRLRQLNSYLFALNFDHPFPTPLSIRYNCIIPYIRAIRETEKWLASQLGEWNYDYSDIRSKPHDWRLILQSLSLGNIAVAIGRFVL
jgi:hypothetical protein